MNSPDAPLAAARRVDESGLGRFALWLMAGLPPVLALAYVLACGVNVTHYDEWDFVPVLEKWSAGTLSLSDLAAPHNEHRIIFPRLLMLALAVLSRYDTRWEMVAGWAILCAGAGALFAYCWRRFGRRALALFVPISWLIFSFRQRENLLWGWQAQVFMAATASVATFYCLETARGMGRILMGAACAAVGTFSFANGILIWPVGLAVVLLVHGRSRLGWKGGLVWAAAFALVVGASLHGRAEDSGHNMALSAKQPFAVAQYVCAYLASPLNLTGYRGVAVGSLLGLAYAVVLLHMVRLWRKGEPSPALPAALILFVLATALLTALGRAGLFGYRHAYESRYVTFSNLGLAGLYLAIAARKVECVFKVDDANLVPAAMAVVFAAIVLPLYAPFEGVAERDVRRHYAHLVRTAETQSDDALRPLYPDVAKLRNRIGILRRLRYNVFADHGGTPEADRESRSSASEGR